MIVRPGLALIALARVLGGAVGWIKRVGINIPLWAIAGLIAASLLDALIGHPIGLDPLARTSEIWNGVLLLAVPVLLLWALRARRRLVVEEFVDHRSGVEPAPAQAAEAADVQAEIKAAGLAPLLTLSLTRLADLHHGSAEPRPISTHAESGGRKGKMVLAGISSGSDPDFLRNAVSAESSLSLGPLNIPVGLLVGLLGRAARGPRMVGGLHQDGRSLTLTAQVAGAGRPYGWKVARPVGGPESPLSEMVEELACRIYTDLATDHTTKWRATRCFAEGLDAYRDTLRTPLNRRLNLRHSERLFLEASAEDQNFDLAYYNLGVVYRDLGKPDAAYGAFMRAIELNPDRLDGYYALAANRWQHGDYEAAVVLCDRVLAGKVSRLESAEALNLRTLARGYQLSPGDPAWADVLGSQRRAVATARRALLRSSLSANEDRDRRIHRARVELSTCLVTLAYACRQGAQEERGQQGLVRAAALIQQAVALDPSAPHVLFSLGDVRLQQGLHSRAGDAFRAAAQIEPSKIDYWAHLALALAQAGDRSGALAAAKRALSSPYSASEDALRVVAGALGELGDRTEAERVASMKRFLRELAQDVAFVDRDVGTVERVASMSTFLSELCEQMEQLEGIGAEPTEVKARLRERKHALRKRIAAEDWHGRAWERAQLQIVLAYLATRDGDWLEAEHRLEAAIAGLQPEHPGEVGERGLRAELARVQLHQGRKGDALTSAQAAVDLDPLSPKSRAALAEVHSSLGEHGAAKDALEVALLRSPEAPEAHVRLGQCILTLAGHCRNKKRRDELLALACAHLRQALDLYPGQQLNQSIQAHELLGRVHLELHEYDEAIARFEIVLALQPSQPLAALEQLAVAYLRNADYPHAETVCEDLEASVGDGDPAEVLDRRGNVEVSRGELLAKAHLLRAQARVERDVDLHRALEFVRHAKRYLREARSDALDLQRLGAFTDTEAECWACEGLILFKQGKLDGAVRRLERAALLRGHPMAYLQLAAVAAEKVELGAGSEGELHALIARAEAYCRRATEADSWKEHNEEICEVSDRVSSLRSLEPAHHGPALGARAATA